MALSKIDELNNYEYIYTDLEIEKILNEYFSVMDISESQKEKRIQAANDFRNVLLFLFTLVATAYEFDYFTPDYILEQFRIEYAKVLLDYATIDGYAEEYFRKTTKSIVDTTLENINLKEKDYWTSDELAITIAENEANGIMNYAELQDAIDNGMTFKEWRAEIDLATRADHRWINGKKIPIEEYFQFPDCEMIAPHDEVNGTAKQTVNCRCALKFS